MPEKSLTLARLLRKRQSDEKIFIMLQEKYQESRITEVGQLGNVRIIDPAISPKQPVKPKKKLNMVLGVLIGLASDLASLLCSNIWTIPCRAWRMSKRSAWR